MDARRFVSRAVAMRRRAFHSGRKKMTAVTKILLAGAILVASCAALPAQQAQTQRLRGTIAKVEGNVLTLKPATGDDVTLTLTGNAMVVAVVKATLADIKEGTFLGSAAMPQPD